VRVELTLKLDAAGAAAEARAAVRSWFGSSPGQSDAAALLLGELIATMEQQGTTELLVTMEQDAARLHVELADSERDLGDRTPPAKPTAGMLALLANDWGHGVAGDPRRVWFELAN
jgi:hypothetical protein